MIKHTYNDIKLEEPTILDNLAVMEMQKEFLTTSCKFNGTCDLNLYNNYIEWLAHTINQSHGCEFNNKRNCAKHTYLVKGLNDTLIGMVEIIFYTSDDNLKTFAHIIECIRPTQRRQGFGKPLLKKAMHECHSLGIKKENISFERNSKACNGTMNKILDF